MATIGPYSVAGDGDDGQIDAVFFSSGGDSDGIGYAGEQVPDATGIYSWVFTRFTLTTAIPPGSTITSAYLELYGRASYLWSDGTDDLAICATDANNPAAPTAYDDRPSLSGGNTTTTTAVVSWPNVTWNTAGWNTSPNLSTIFQELVDSGYCDANNDTCVLWVRRDGISNETSIVGIELSEYAGSSNTAKLTVTYTDSQSNAPRVTRHLQNMMRG